MYNNPDHAIGSVSTRNNLKQNTNLSNPLGSSIYDHHAGGHVDQSRCPEQRDAGRSTPVAGPVAVAAHGRRHEESQRLRTREIEEARNDGQGYEALRSGSMSGNK